MAIAHLGECPKFVGQELPAQVTVLRHGKKTDAGGPLDLQGWKSARLEGVRIGQEAANAQVGRLLFFSGDVHRTRQTAQAMANGAEEGYIHQHTRQKGSVPTDLTIEIGPSQPELSLSSIADGSESVLVQEYRKRARKPKKVVAHHQSLAERLPIPWPAADLWYRVRHPNLEKAEQNAIGQLLIDWIAMDNKRPQAADGSTDTHTRSAREVAIQQAVSLKRVFTQAIQSCQEGNPTTIVECTHENMPLLIARYFLYQKLKSKRRGYPNVILDGMDIIKKIGGKIPYLSGINFHFFKQEDGSVHVRARFNNAWYEVNMDMIDAFVEEANPDEYLREDVDLRLRYARWRYAKALERKGARQQLYRDWGLAA